MVTWLLHSLYMEWYLFGWRSGLEISCIAGALYWWMRMLAQDRQKPLLIWFLGYCTFLSGTYYLHLPTLQLLAAHTAPALLMLFILIHQETLQKNSIRLCNITPPQPIATDWLTSLIRLCMIALTDKKELFIVIEKQDALNTLIDTSFMLHASVTDDLLSLLYTSALTNTNEIWWLTRHGKLLGINAHLRHTEYDWLADALMLSSKTDCLIIKTDVRTHLFTIMAQAKYLETYNATDALSAARRYLGLTREDKTYEQRMWYDTNTHLSHQSSPST